MARTLSQDLRDRVIAAVDGGMSRNAAAVRFGVAAATAVRWVRAWRTDGLPTPRPKGGDLRSQRIEAYRDVILAAVDAQKDMTLVELSTLLREQHGAAFAPSTIWRFLDRHDMTFKKNRTRQRAGAARRRRTQAGLVRGPARPRSGTPGVHR
jgi:transposase